ncbi:unnamed protein product, partial [marine sediment metagenome]
SSKKPDLRLILVGDGNYRTYLERYVHEKGVQSKVSFEGYQLYIDRYILDSDIFINPSHVEGMPNTVLEADFTEIMDILKIYTMIEEYSELPKLIIQIIDFRKEQAYTTKFGAIKRRVILDGDPEGSIEIDLHSSSLLQELSDDYEKFRVTQYDKDKIEQSINKVMEGNCEIIWELVKDIMPLKNGKYMYTISNV